MYEVGKWRPWGVYLPLHMHEISLITLQYLCTSIYPRGTLQLNTGPDLGASLLILPLSSMSGLLY